MTTHIAVVPYQISIESGLLTRVAAALQRQVREHFGPLWKIDATVSPFAGWEDVPPEYARLILVDHLDSGSLGVHADRDGQPYALVAARGDWPIVASHECLEMLADPTGKQTRRGPSPKDGSAAEFLVEVCDPCQGSRWSYKIDGVPVSDFCTPSFYDGTGASGERWSYGGHITGPRQILKDGYMSWHDPVGQQWWRRDWLGRQVTDYSLGPIPPSVSCLRGGMDRIGRRERGHLRGRGARFAVKPGRAARAKARALTAELEALLAPPRPRKRGRR
ncbi:MAG TPA: hypothetical protein VN253_18225 [Kofleriaceae bacterium]|nr:hypothetical protein [Kofleriaceae bacterium]